MKGFTLVEMLIVTSAALIVGVLLVAIMLSNSSFFYRQSALIDEGLSLNDAMQEIDKNTRQAVALPLSLVEGGTTYTADSDTLILKLPALASSEVITDVYDYTVVNKDPSQSNILRLLVFPDVNSLRKSQSLVLTKSLGGITFSYLDNAESTVSADLATQVKVTLTVTPSGTKATPRTATIITSLRN